MKISSVEIWNHVETNPFIIIKKLKLKNEL